MILQRRRAVVGLRSWGLLLGIAWGLLPQCGGSAVSASTAAPANTTACTGGIRPQDSFWIVSSRHLGCPDPNTADIQQFHYRRYDPQFGCQPAEAAELLLDQRERTVIYVHGNRIEADEVFERGLRACRALTGSGADPASIRFIVWSWPSDRLCGPRRDAQTKTWRSDVESFYLALLISQLPADTQLGMFGYSLGGRVISGAVQLAGGGERCGYRLPDPAMMLEPGPRIALMAPALDRSWWLEGRPHDLVPALAAAILVLYNPCDPVLKWYPRLDRATRPQALGYTGFPWAYRLGADGEKIETLNVCCQVGREHDEQLYMSSPVIMQHVRQCLLGF